MALIDDLIREYGINEKKAAKLVKLSRKSESAYSRALIELASKVNAKVEAVVIPGLPSVWESDNWPAVVQSLVTGTRSGLGFELATPVLTSAWAKDVQKAAGNQWEQTLKNAFGVDVQALVQVQPKAPVRDAVQAAINENVKLIKSIPEKHLDQVERIINQSRNGGATVAQTAKAIREVYPVTKKRARLIARDQTNKLAATINQIQQQQAGVTSYFWHGQLDERERKLHLAREGRLFQWTDPPEDGHPGHPVNCFTGSTHVHLSHGCNKLWRRLYSGPLVSIRLSDGTLLEATPNHPIFTAGGWVKIDDLQCGDNVFQAVRNNVSVGEPDHANLVTSFDDLFEAMVGFVGAESTAGSALDFHGDGTEHDIDTVDVDSFLSRNLKSLRFKSGNNLNLTGTPLSKQSGIFNVFGIALRSLTTINSATRCIISGLGKVASFFGTHLGVSNKHRLASGSDGNGICSQHAPDCGARDAVFTGQALDAYAGSVIGGNFSHGQIITAVVRNFIFGALRSNAPSAESLAQAIGATPHAQADLFENQAGIKQGACVVEKTVREFIGHVYNLQSDTGYYIANGVVAHNCRCWARPNFKGSTSTTQPKRKFIAEPVEAVKPKAITKEEIAAISDYTGGDYAEINAHLRGGLPISEKTKTKLSAIDEILNRSSLPEETKVYRAFGTHAVDQLLTGVTEGDYIKDSGLMSTTLNKSVAESGMRRTHGKGFIAEIEVPRGTKALDISPHSTFSGEQEILIARNSVLQVLELDEKARTIKLKVMPPEFDPKAKTASRDSQPQRPPPEERFTYANADGLILYKKPTA